MENDAKPWDSSLSASSCVFSAEQILFDFTNASSTSTIDDWVEISDTERDVGKSKAVLVEQKTQQFQRAVFFTLLNPQPNGAGFAGVAYRNRTFDLGAFTGLKLSVRAQGENFFYKVILRHHNEESSLQPSYEIFFEVKKTPKKKLTWSETDVFHLVTEEHHERPVFGLRWFQTLQPGKTIGSQYDATVGSQRCDESCPTDLRRSLFARQATGGIELRDRFDLCS